MYIRRFEDTRNRDERSFWLILDGCGEMLRDPYRDYVIRDENDKWNKTYLSAVARSKRDQTGCDQVQRDPAQLPTTAFPTAVTPQPSGIAVVTPSSRTASTGSQLSTTWVPSDKRNWNEGYVHTESEWVPEGQVSEHCTEADVRR